MAELQTTSAAAEATASNTVTKKPSVTSDTRQPSKAEPAVAEFAAETKPTVVAFPRHKDDESFPSLKLEGDEVEERNTNPVVLWQVYAIGSFLIMKWAWTRWNERRGRKKPSGEEPPPAGE